MLPCIGEIVQQRKQQNGQSGQIKERNGLNRVRKLILLSGVCWINRESCWRSSVERWLGEITREIGRDIAPILTIPDFS